jgi:PAS domain S-box-containing protein
LVGNAEDIISLIDENGKVIYVSPAFEKATGYTVIDYMVGKNFSEIMHPENIYDSKNIFSELLLHPGKLFHRQNRFRHKDGHHFWVEGTVINLLNDENVKAIVANHRDVSDKFKSRDTAIEMNERFSIVSKATHDVVWDWNLVTNVIWWNENFYTLFGYDKDETEHKY